MSKAIGFSNYKKYWEDQAVFMDKSTWDKEKILKLTISRDFENNIEELRFSNHSLEKEDRKLI